MCDLCQIRFFFKKSRIQNLSNKRKIPSFSNHRKHLHLMLNVHFSFQANIKKLKNNNLTTFQ